MDNITASDLHGLASITGNNCVSIYMPTHPAGREGQQDSLRLKNLVVAAEQQLIAHGMRGVVARDFLKPINELANHPAWERRKQGLAIFLSDNVFLAYWFNAPLEEASLVGGRFYLKRLLPVACATPQFFILALSRGQVRLLKVTWQGCDRVRLENLPNSMELALNLQPSDRGEQVHSGMRGDLGKQAAVFHGQGGHRDTLKEEIANYFRLIDDSLRPPLRQYPWPLVLAGVEYELAIFREVSGYNHIADEEIYGCFDHVDDQTLYQESLAIAQQFSENVRAQAVTRYRGLAGTNQTSNLIETIVPAAFEGRIETLLADPCCEVSGRFHPETNAIEFVSDRDPAYDLVETSISQTILHRGTVYSFSRDALPSRRTLRAIFRY